MDEIRRRWREEPGLTKEGLAREYGVSDTRIYEILKGAPRAEKKSPAGPRPGQPQGNSPKGDGTSQEAPPPPAAPGTDVKYQQRLSLPVIVDIYYEDALRRGYQGTKEDFLAEVVLGYFARKGLEFGIIRRAHETAKAQPG